MNAVNQNHNEKDNEMVQLTKIILKQTARHSMYATSKYRDWAPSSLQVYRHANYEDKCQGRRDTGGRL